MSGANKYIEGDSDDVKHRCIPCSECFDPDSNRWIATKLGNLDDEVEGLVDIMERFEVMVGVSIILAATFGISRFANYWFNR